MPQHAMSVPNAEAAVVRAGFNAALLALVTQSAGPAAPTTTYAGQPWWDTTNSLMKIRNATNTAWVTTASFDGTTWIPYVDGVPPLTGPALTGIDSLTLTEQGAAPTTPANSLARYAKRVSGRLEAFIRDESSGAEIQETSNGLPAGVGIRSTSVSLVGVGSATITGIPAGTNLIIASGLDMGSPAGALLLRLGHAGGVANAGYVAATSRHTNGSAANVALSTTGFFFSPADPLVNATATYVLFRVSSNIWGVLAGASDTRDAGYIFSLQGRISLSGELDRVQLLLSSGSFTSGAFNLEAWR